MCPTLPRNEKCLFETKSPVLNKILNKNRERSPTSKSLSKGSVRASSPSSGHRWRSAVLEAAVQSIGVWRVVDAPKCARSARPVAWDLCAPEAPRKRSASS